MVVKWTQKLVVSIPEVLSNLVASIVANFCHLSEAVRRKLVAAMWIKRVSWEVGCSIAVAENLVEKIQNEVISTKIVENSNLVRTNVF